jgi:2-polyprenyl-3-methyl-5-hydroxy-6-metoxy-1,4-benzoquinol methylase
VLDVGVSNKEHNDQINLFLNEFRFSPNQYTGLAIQSMDNIAKKHPGKRFVQYPGSIFPFYDNEFDWVFSNAVIEHVGSEDDQILFINEMLRVAKNVFFTTPNKYFPVESHTNTIFRHWSNKGFYKWCRKNKPFWSKDNLVLLDFKQLNALMTKSNAKHYIIQKNRVLGWTMTFTVVCSD